MIENGFEVAPETLYDLIGTIYRSSDAFVSNFDENYPTIAELADHIVTLARKPGSVLLVDSIGKKKLGFLHIEPRGPHKLRHTAELTMGVSPEARGLGIGRELLDAALEKLRAEGIIEIVYLTVRADNIAAIRLYERCGFESLALLERDLQIDGRYCDGVLMRRLIEKVESTRSAV